MKEKIRLLYITRKYPPQVGGMETFSYNLFKGFDPDRVEKKIISLGKGQANLVWFVPYCIIYCALFARKYDVVFIGDAVLCLLNGIVKMFARKTKTVINVFGLDITYQKKIYQKYLSWCYKKADKYICISKETEKMLRQRGNFDSVVITPGIALPQKPLEKKRDYAAFASKFDVPDGASCLLTVGRLVKRKGVAWFLGQVMPRLKAENLRYFVVGDGEDREIIETIVAEQGLGDCVNILGRVDDDTLEMLYRNCDIFVMPNIPVENDMEGFGIVAVEAAISEMLVVASGIEGIKDAIIPQKNGVLLPAGDAEAYCSAIKTIMADKQEWEQKARQFAEFTKNTYHWGAICDQYLDLFESLLGKG